MKTKTYILQAGFLPIGQTDVTGWRTYSFHSGRGAYDTTRKDAYVPVFGFKSAASTL